MRTIRCFIIWECPHNTRQNWLPIRKTTSTLFNHEVSKRVPICCDRYVASFSIKVCALLDVGAAFSFSIKFDILPEVLIEPFLVSIQLVTW